MIDAAAEELAAEVDFAATGLVACLSRRAATAPPRDRRIYLAALSDAVDALGGLTVGGRAAAGLALFCGGRWIGGPDGI